MINLCTDIGELICIQKFFPEADLRGFWICCRRENSESNGTKFVFMRIFSGYPLDFSLDDCTSSAGLQYKNNIVQNQIPNAQS